MQSICTRAINDRLTIRASALQASVGRIYSALRRRRGRILRKRRGSPLIREKEKDAKQILICQGAGLIGLMYPTHHKPLVFTFLFTNTTGTTNGTVTGDIDGLTLTGTGVAATNVILDSYPTGLGLPLRQTSLTS